MNLPRGFCVFANNRCSGEKFEKNATAIPRQSGYLETARAMYEYAYYKDDEVTQARGMSTSVGTLPILQEANYLRITSSFLVCSS